MDIDWRLLAAVPTTHHRVELILRWRDAGLFFSYDSVEELLRGAGARYPTWDDIVASVEEAERCLETDHLRRENPGTIVAPPWSKRVLGLADWCPDEPDHEPFFGVDRTDRTSNPVLVSGATLSLLAEMEADLEAKRAAVKACEPLMVASRVETDETPSEPAERCEQPATASQRVYRCPNCGRETAPEHATPVEDSLAVDVRCWWCETGWREEA